MHTNRKTWTFAVSLVGMLLVGAATAGPAAASDDHWWWSSPGVKADYVKYATPISRARLHMEVKLKKDGKKEGHLYIEQDGPLLPFKAFVEVNDMVIGPLTPLGSLVTVSGKIKKIQPGDAAGPVETAILEALLGQTIALTVLDSDNGTDNDDDNDLPDQVSLIAIGQSATAAHALPLAYLVADGRIRANQP